MNDRTPPHDEAAEQAVLGSMLISPDAISAVVDRLSGADFYAPKHETVWDAIVALYTDGKPVDAITVAHALQRSGELPRVGGAPYLHDLSAAPTSALSVEAYAGIVADRATARRVIEAAAKATALGYSGQMDAADLAARCAAEMQSTVGSVRERDTDDELYQQILDIADGTSEAVKGWSYGFYDLDGAMVPLTAGQLVIIGGRPGMGKSVMGNSIAHHVAWRQGGKVLIAGLEMSRREVWQRLYAAHASVQLNRVLRLNGQGPEGGEWDRLAKAQELNHCERIVVEDQRSRPAMGLAELRAAIRQHRPDVVIVDYLQLLREPTAESRQQGVSKLCRGLKLLAQLEEVPIVALCQLNREVTGRADKRPGLTDLRESGSIEQEADVVILLHREDYYDSESAHPGEVEFIVAKQRNGPTFVMRAAAQLHYARFVDMAVDTARELQPR
jgi:replicative DNA helicase